MRLMRRMLAASPLLLVAACGGGDLVGNRVKDEPDLNAMATAGPTVEEVLARGDDRVAPDRPPEPFDHVGRWAAGAAQCERSQWVFTPAGVTAGSETRCLVTGTEVVSDTSKKLALRCTTSGIETIESWALNLHQDRRMTVSRSEGGNGVPRSTTLQRCSS